jgi:hypothetical protein
MAILKKPNVRPPRLTPRIRGKISSIRSALKRLSASRKEQKKMLHDLESEREVKEILPKEVQKQRNALNELDGFPTAVTDSEPQPVHGRRVRPIGFRGPEA